MSNNTVITEAQEEAFDIALNGGGVALAEALDALSTEEVELTEAEKASVNNF